MEYKLSDGTVLLPETKLVCKDSVVFQGMVFDKGCIMHVVEEEHPLKNLLGVKIETRTLSSTLTDHAGLRLPEVDFYVKEGKMEIIKTKKKDKLIEAIVRQLGVDAETIKDETTLGDLYADDLDSVELAMHLEDAFGISIREDDWPTSGDHESFTVKQMRDLINRKLQEKK